MMLAAQECLYALLQDPDFAEVASFIASGADPTSAVNITCVIERHDSELERAQDAGEYWNNARIKCLGPISGVLDPAFGGLIAPAVADRWSFPLLRGGSPNLQYWKAGAPTGGNGIWIIPVKFYNRYETGGQRKHAGA